MMKKQKTDLTNEREIEGPINLIISRRFDLHDHRDKTVTINLPEENITLTTNQLISILDVLALGKETLGVHRMATYLAKSLTSIK